MIKTKFSISLHILTLLALYPDEWMSSSSIAGSLNINPVLVRKELLALKEGALIESKEGKHGGVRLAKKATQIRLSEIFEIVKGSEHVLSLLKNTPNPNCKVGKQINQNLEVVLSGIDDAIIKELGKQSLEEFKNRF
ncbi:MAG: Rrf2 family transcriptional regulator [Bacteroidota bacterium]